MKHTAISPRVVFLLALSGVLLFASCADDEVGSPAEKNLAKFQDGSVSLKWMQLYTEIDRYAINFRPAPVSRTLAYINIAAYQAAIAGMPDYQSVQGMLYGLHLPPPGKAGDYHWPTVVNTVYASLFKKFIPSNILVNEQQLDLQFKILTLEQQFNDEFEAKLDGVVFDRSVEYGKEVANAVFDWSKTDKFGHEAYLNPRPLGYTPPQGPGLWQASAPDYRRALFPFWGRVRTFALQIDDKISKQPLAFSESAGSPLYAQAIEVKNTVQHLDFTKKWIAQFWSDDEPGLRMSNASHWVSIANQAIEKEQASLELALFTYAKLSIALSDATVACWNSKYTYNTEYPVSYIRRVIDPNWNTYYLSSMPDFPAYPSDHATIGAAAAEVLSSVFGYSYSMVDRTHEGRTDFFGKPRTFSSFYEMAQENAYSRILLGVSYRMGAEEGLRHGIQIGRKVNQMPFFK